MENIRSVCAHFAWCVWQHSLTNIFMHILLCLKRFVASEYAASTLGEKVRLLYGCNLPKILIISKNASVTVVQNSILYKKLSERMTMSVSGVSLGGAGVG